MNSIFWLILITVAGVNLIVAPCTVTAYDICKSAWVIILTAAMVIIWSGKVFRTNRFYGLRKTETINKALLCYLVTVIIAVVFSGNWIVNVIGNYKRHDGLLSLIIYIALFVIAANFITRLNIHILINVLISTGVICSVLGFVQSYVMASSAYFTFGQRAYSTFGQPVFFAIFLAMIIPLAYYKIISSERLVTKILYMVIVVMFIVSIINTQTRSGILAIIVSTAAFLGLSKLWNKHNVIVIGGILAIIIGINTFCGDNLTILFSKMALSNNNARIDILKSTIPIIKENLWVGSGNEVLHKRIGSNVFNLDKAHNEIVQHLMAYGIFGLCAYLYLVFCYCKDTWKVYRYIPGSKLLAVTLFSCCLSYFVFVQFNPSHIPISTTFWVLLGATYGVKNVC